MVRGTRHAGWQAGSAATVEQEDKGSAALLLLIEQPAPLPRTTCTLQSAFSTHLSMGPSKIEEGSASLASTTRTVSSTATITCTAGGARAGPGQGLKC